MHIRTIQLFLGNKQLDIRLQMQKEESTLKHIG